MVKPFAKVRSSAVDGRVHNPYYKLDQLKSLHRVLADNSRQIQESIKSDTGYRTADVKVEYWLALRCIAKSYASIDPKKILQDEYAIASGQDVPDAREPYGIVVIEPSQHAFFVSLVSVLAPALAAGNCVVVQVGQSLSKTPPLVLNLISQALDNDIFEVTHNPIKDADVGHRHIAVLQNGVSSSPTLGSQLVSDPEAPVVAFVERDADIEAAAKALVGARFCQGGEAPYAPDIVLVNEWVRKDFLKAVAQLSISFMTGVEDPGQSRKTSGSGLVEEARKEGMSNIISSGSGRAVLDVENRQSFLLKRKIKQSCLLVHSVRSMDDAIDISTSFGQLAASYVFTTPAMAKYLCQFIRSNASFVNQVPTRLLYGPIAPEAMRLDHASGSIYDQSLFTVPKPKYITVPEVNHRLDALLGEGSSQQIDVLDVEATRELTEMKRPMKRVDIGFFPQGILTGLVITLISVVTGVGVAGYYLSGYLRSYRS